MLTPVFRLSASQRHEIAVVCGIGAARLGEIASKIAFQDLTIRRSKIEGVLHEEVGQENGAALANLLFGIAGTFRRTPTSAREFLDRISGAIEAASEDEPRLKIWDECRPAIEQLLTTQSISLAAKALDISYDFERVCIAGRILTSIRPVFNDLRGEILGSTIVQTLRLEYISPDGHQSSISIAVDADDIKQLMTECERALNKAKVAKDEIENKFDFEAIIPGEERQ
jgi:hypothetical protein